MHRSTWDPKHGWKDRNRPKFQPYWSYCHMCYLVGKLEEAKPPGKYGYHIAFREMTYPS